jgi:hypothetical protein
MEIRMTSIGVRLRGFIQAWSSDMLQHPLAQLARSGQLPAPALAAYLESLRLVFASSERSLPLALERSKQLGDPGLVGYFERKIPEELGHDRWAADDLQQLPATAKENLSALPSALRLIQLQRDLIADHPLYFVAYILWAEYFSVLVGDSWLDALESSGYARRQVTAVSKHIETDREHAAAVIQEIDTLWHGEPSQENIVHAVQRASQLFEAFCAEIHGVAQRAA